MKPSDYIKKGWCQVAAALDKNGQEEDPTSTNACKWCLFGAFEASGTSVSGSEWESLRNLFGGSPIDWNETPGRTQAEVIAALESVGL